MSRLSSTVYAEVRPEEGGEASRFPLTGDRAVIGRSAEVGVRLDSGTVSRQHAELFRDPYGRWWVRDLGSRNGTRVNGVRVDEQLLEPTDTIQVENFLIQVRGQGSGTDVRRRASNSAASITLSDGQTGRITSLLELSPSKISADHIKALSAFSRLLLDTPEPQDRLQKLCLLMVGEQFHGNSAVVLRIDADPASTSAEVEVLCGPESSKNWKRGELPYVSKTMLRAARQTRAPVVASNVDNGTGVVNMSLAGNVMQVAAVACPLHGDDLPTMDLLYVTFPAEYGTGEWLALSSLASEQYTHSEAAWEGRRRAQEQALIETELQRANQIQHRLIPQKVNIKGLDVAVGFKPCKWVGGDYVDAVQLPDGRGLLVVGDVCGKGLQAALITASLHAMVHTNIRPGLEIADFMNRLNEYLCQTLPDASFVTMAGMTIDPATGQIDCVNAGHPPVIVLSPDGSVRMLQDSANPPLGFAADPLTAFRDKLLPGEVATIYTDGLTEMCHHDSLEMLGIEGVGKFLSESLAAAGDDRAAGTLRDKFDGLLDKYQGTALPQDDKGFLLARRV